MREHTGKILLVALVVALSFVDPAHAQYAAPTLHAPMTHWTHAMPSTAREAHSVASRVEELAVAAPRRRFILIGAGIGAAVGAVIGVISVQQHPPSGSYGPGRRGTIVGVGILGAIAGALVGWLVSTGAG
jgi:hypothetical protein